MILGAIMSIGSSELAGLSRRITRGATEDLKNEFIAGIEKLARSSSKVSFLRGVCEQFKCVTSDISSPDGTGVFLLPTEGGEREQYDLAITKDGISIFYTAPDGNRMEAYLGQRHSTMGLNDLFASDALLGKLMESTTIDKISANIDALYKRTTEAIWSQDIHSIASALGLDVKGPRYRFSN